MARQVKNNCDYFPHDAGMRNHRKVKAIRGQFPNGYAIWSMLLEYLTDADGSEFEYGDLEIQIMAGDFGFSPEEIKSVIEYCLKLEMLFEKNGFIYSESLNEKLAPVFEKRGKARDISRKQHRMNGKYVTETTDEPGLLTSEIREIRVNRIEVNRIKEEDKSSVETVVSPAIENSINQDWDKIPKTKNEVYNFILKRKPLFIEPYVEMWNIWAKERGKSQVKTITKDRKQKFKSRIQEKGFDFLAMLTKAKESQMCLTQSWFSFDFLIQNEKGYIRLLEGNYDNEKIIKKESTTNNSLDDRLEQKLREKQAS
jgi:hypothetical protein